MDDENIEFVSKTELKKDSKKIQTFGKKISELSSEEISSFNFPDIILKAIKDCKSIKSNVAKKRQVQYLGKLLREIDLSEAYLRMDQINSNSQLEVRNNHRVEIWRERLIQDKNALTELIGLCPDIDRQKIRQLIQNTLKERKASNPPKYYRQLFKYIKEHIMIIKDLH